MIVSKPGDAVMDYSRIKELRIDSDTTQQELAQYLHVTRSAYSNYENGLREIPIEVLSGLADFYQTSLDYLLKRTDERSEIGRAHV